MDRQSLDPNRARLFGRDAPRAEFQGSSIRGLAVEQHLGHLREGLLPLAERCGRVLRDALAALDAAPSRAVERSRSLPDRASAGGCCRGMRLFAAKLSLGRYEVRLWRFRVLVAKLGRRIYQ